MSVDISLLNTCHYCEASLVPGPESEVKTDTDYCWNCGRLLKNPTNKHFECPDYLHHQRNSLIEELGRGKLKPGDTKYDEKIQEFQKDLISWVRGCTSEDRIAPLHDSVVIMENLIYTTTTGEDFKTIISLAKKIGNLANVLEQYFKAGGCPYDRKIRRLRPDGGESSWDQATATAGGDT